MDKTILNVAETAGHEYRSAYLVKIGDKSYIFREPTLGEWIFLEKFADSKMCSEGYLVKKLLIYPKPESLMVGEAVRLGEEIYKAASVFSDDEKISLALDKEREKLDSHEDIDSIILTICSAFPAYKPEDVHNFNFQTLMKRIAQAERILQPQQPPGAKNVPGLSPQQSVSAQTSSVELQKVLAKRKGQIKKEFKPFKE